MKDRIMRVNGVSLIPGTPDKPLEEPALIVKLWRAIKTFPDAPMSKAGLSHAMASVHMVKPGRAGYVIKQLIRETEMVPDLAIARVVAAAKLNEVSQIFVNADLQRLPLLPCARHEHSGSDARIQEDEHVRFSLALP